MPTIFIRMHAVVDLQKSVQRKNTQKIVKNDSAFNRSRKRK